MQPGRITDPPASFKRPQSPWEGSAQRGQGAEVVQASATALRVRVPAGAQSGRVEVRTPGGVAQSPGAFEVIMALVLPDFSPKQGPVSTIVALTGNNFGASGRPDTVRINGMAVPVLAATSTQRRPVAQGEWGQLAGPSGSYNDTVGGGLIFEPLPLIKPLWPARGGNGAGNSSLLRLPCILPAP